VSFKYLAPNLPQLNVSIDEILDLLKVEERTSENPVFSEIERIFAELPETVEIRGGYVIFEDIEIQIDKGRILMNENEILPERKVCTYLKNSEKIAVFICSAGERFSILSGKCNSEGDYLRGYIIDAFGSLVAEKTAGFIQNEIEKEAALSGQNITNRYSPGYCNWHLCNQKELFALLPENACNISLTESSLMLPIKSVSGIIGIGKKVKHSEYKCQTCNDKNCVYRKLKNV
jgi:hypothetical protein